MRGRKSSRGAAVVLAGCVGLAVMAPGLAVAATLPGVTTEEACTAAAGTWDPATASCDDGVVATEPTPTESETSPTTTTTAPAGPTAGTPPAGPTAGTADDTSTNGGGAPAAGTEAAPGSATTPSAPAASPRLVAEGSQQLQNALAGITLPGGITLPDTFVPGGGNLPLDLGALPIPTTVPDGGFLNPQEQCAFLAGGLTVPVDQAAALGAAFSQFCAGLPTSFTALPGFDPTALIDDLLDLINGLVPSLPVNGGTISTTPPASVPAAYHGYWFKQYDVNCPELTGAEADAIFASDPSDPFNLDGDNDGVPCEDNPRSGSARYVGYPVGGVSTGDGSTGGDVSPFLLALAGAGVGGVALSGLTLVRRFGRTG